MKKNETNIKLFLTSLFACSLLFVINCGNSLNKSNSANESAGNGTFVLQIGDANTQMRAMNMQMRESLTIMPSQSDFENKIELYVLTFNEQGGRIETATIEKGRSSTVSLPAGTYDLELTAYDAITGGNLIAEGELKTVKIDSNSTTIGKVTLNGIMNGAAQGTFYWEITYPANVSVKMDITPLPNGAVAATKNFPAGTVQFDNKDSINLASGQYSVIFTVEKPNMRTVTWREALHIYGNMTSRFIYKFTDDHFIASSYLVTFWHGNSGPTPGIKISDKTYFYYGQPDDPVNPSGYTFFGWYEEPACITPAGIPLKDNLYARWISNNAWDGSADPAPISLNSNELLYIENPRYGWYVKTIDGKWLSGEMEYVGEQGNMEIDVDAGITHTGQNGLKGAKGIVGNGLGKWEWVGFTSGSIVCSYLDVDIYIPYKNLNYYIASVDAQEVVLTKFNAIDHFSSCILPTSPINYRAYRRCWHVSSAGGLTLKLKIDIDASSGYEYNSAGDSTNHYPIFEQTGGAVYYWRDGSQDMCSILGEPVKILDFNPGNTPASIKIRPFSIMESDTVFEEIVGGEDIELVVINSSNYRSKTDYLKINNVTVGEIKVEVIGHIQQQVSPYGISRVTLKVTYNLDSSFFPSGVNKILCNGMEVPSNGIITMERNHGPITINTEFK